MRLLDEQGRLFGKINIIDFFALVFLISLLPMGYFGYKVFTARPEEAAPVKETVELELNCRIIKLPPEDLKYITAGAKDLDRNGQVKGEIISIGEISPYKYDFEIERGRLSVEEHNLRQVKAKIRIKAEINGNKPFYNGKEIGSNSELEFRIYQGERSIRTFPGGVKKIPIEKKVYFLEQSELVEERVVDFNILLKDIEPELAREICAGDTETDESGKITAKVISLGKIENNVFTLGLKDGAFTKGEDHSKKQLHVKIRMRCKMNDTGVLYYKGQEIGLGSLLELKFKGHLLTGVIDPSYLKEVWVRVTVKFSGISPETAALIREEDAEKNVYGGTIGRICAVTVKPQEVLVLNEKQWVALTHPSQKDALAVIDVLCMEKDDMFYFKNYPVKVGNNIVFSTDRYSLWGVINEWQRDDIKKSSQ